MPPAARGGVRRRERRRFAGAAPSRSHLSLRRLHPHAAPTRATGPASSGCGARAPTRAISTGATTTGLYCAGCEAFLDDADLVDGACPEHGAPPEPVDEHNWFFRLSRYDDALRERSSRGRLGSSPSTAATRCSRSSEAAWATSASRARASARGGWGIPVPGDPEQVDLRLVRRAANYITALGYGTGGGAYGALVARARRRRACRSARASPASTPSTGRRSCSRPACRCRRRSSSTTT